MAILPEQDNPFSKTLVYETLKIEPNAPPEKIERILSKITTKSLGKKVDPETLELIKGRLNQLKRSFSRVTINALMLDTIDPTTVGTIVKGLPRLGKQEIELPEPDVSNLYIEGQNIEISEQDFESVDKDKSLELEFEQLREHLTPKSIEQYHLFET